METSLLKALSEIVVTQGLPTVLILFVCVLIYKLSFFETTNDKGEKVHTNILSTILDSFNRLVVAVEDLSKNFQTQDIRVEALNDNIEEVKDNQRCPEHLQTLREIKQEMAKEKTLKELEEKITKGRR